ncbi:MAG TPA: hypothetical protein VFN48_11455 [Solirubrobacteraceae bacterium]|nr:hypothetical protein [Solirubrobacteraceae bacterium]
MSHRIISSRSGAAAAGVIAAAALGVGQASAATAHQLRGTVVHHNARAHSFVVAAANGTLYAIHAGRLPALGTRVSVDVTRLANGTFAARRTHVSGRLRHGQTVRTRGVVSFVDRASRTYTLSARGVSLLVHADRQAHSTGVTMPTVGSTVTSTGAVTPTGIDAQSTTDQGAASSTYQLEGVILSVDPTANTITVSADDDNLSGASITVSVPAPLSVSVYQPGQEVELQVQDLNGTVTLLGSSSDQGYQGANGQADQQDNQGDQGDQGDQNNQGDSGSTSSTDSSSSSSSSDGSSPSSSDGSSSSSSDGSSSSGS